MTPSVLSRQFGHLWRPRHAYLLDPSLHPDVSSAVRTFRWDIRTVADHFHGGDVEKRVLDERIIPECKKQGFVWVTADEGSQVDHCEAIYRHRINVLWIHRPGGAMSRDYQFAALTYAIGAFDCRLDLVAKAALWCELRGDLPDRLEVLKRIENGRKWRIGRR